MNHRIKLEARRRLALQFAEEHLLSVRQILDYQRKDAAVSAVADVLLGHLCGLHDSIVRARENGDTGHGIGGTSCGCHGGGLPTRTRPHKADCERCHGTGTVPIAEIRRRAEEGR